MFVQYLSKVAYIIKSLRAVLSPYIWRSIYFTYIQSCLWHGIMFWGGDNEIKMAFRVQKGLFE